MFQDTRRRLHFKPIKRQPTICASVLANNPLVAARSQRPSFQTNFTLMQLNDVGQQKKWGGDSTHPPHRDITLSGP